MTCSLTLEELLPLLESGQEDALRGALVEEHAVDIAALVGELEPQEAVRALSVLPTEQQARVFDNFELPFQQLLAEHMENRHLAELMNLMPHDDRAALLKSLPDELSDPILALMAEAEREDIRRLASYPEGSAGAIMTTDYAVVYPELTVQQAIDKLRREAPYKETINRAYIIDSDRHLLGALKLQTLILSSPQTRIGDIMDPHTHVVRVDDSQEYVAQQIAKYDVIALPVVDQDNRLVGIVTHDDALDVLEEETTEDIYKTGTVGKLPGSIRDVGVWLLYRKRVTWLVLLVFGNLFSGLGIAFFEETIASYVVLVFFLPLLIGSSGNAGSQSATLMVRALATGDVEMQDWGWMLGRELLVASGLGLTMAVAVSGIGMYRGGSELAVVVALTMVLVVMVGSLIGMSLPFLLSRFRLDPAMASAPLITSIADVMGVVIYFTIATAFLFPSA